MAILEGEEHYGSLKLFHSCFHLSEEINKKLKVNAHNNISAEPTTTTEELAKFIKMTVKNKIFFKKFIFIGFLGPICY